jgi:hypothetical protein
VSIDAVLAVEGDRLFGFAASARRRATKAGTFLPP